MASEGQLPTPAHQHHGPSELGLQGGAHIRRLQSVPGLQRKGGGTRELCGSAGSEASLDPGGLLPFHPSSSLAPPLPAPKRKRVPGRAPRPRPLPSAPAGRSRRRGNRDSQSARRLPVIPGASDRPEGGRPRC